MTPSKRTVPEVIRTLEAMPHNKPLSLNTIAEVYAEMAGWNTTDDFRAAWHLHSDGLLYMSDDLLFCGQCGCSSLDEDIGLTDIGWLCLPCQDDAKEAGREREEAASTWRAQQV